MKLPALTLPQLPPIPLRRAVWILLVLLASCLAAVLATPRLHAVDDAVNLDQTIPKRFGDWVELPSPFMQVALSTGNETSIDQPYDQVVMRTYTNSQGQRVQIAVAWGRRQRQEVKIHRPDLCYVAQGWPVQSLVSHRFNGITHTPKPVDGKRMLAGRNGAMEAVSYWMRIGSLFSEDAVDTRLHILREGLKGRIPDGVLVRASVRINDANEAPQAWGLAEQFLADLSESVSPPTAEMLVGRSRDSLVSEDRRTSAYR